MSIYSPENNRLYGLRGKDFAKEYKRLYTEVGGAVTQRYFEVVEKSGKFTPKNLGQLAREFRLTIKVMDEWLPDLTNGNYPFGTWERLKDRGVKASQLLEEIKD